MWKDFPVPLTGIQLVDQNVLSLLHKYVPLAVVYTIVRTYEKDVGKLFKVF